ncbi:Hpt domain-containing protein [bacterium]|nr:Hpt domain-containing protein [bacterium]
MSDEIVVYIDPDLEDLTPGFLANRQNDTVVISKLIEAGDYAEIQRLGHSMKGSGGGYGFDEISNIGTCIEEAAKRANKDEILQQNKRLQHYISHVKVIYEEEE